MKIDISGNNIYELLQESVNKNDPKIIDKILKFNNYIDMTKSDVEKKVFALSYFLFEQFKNDMPIKHLIFNYKISEANSIDISVDINPNIKNMFENRKLNSDLKSNLNKNKQNKKQIKI